MPTMRKLFCVVLCVWVCGVVGEEHPVDTLEASPPHTPTPTHLATAAATVAPTPTPTPAEEELTPTPTPAEEEPMPTPTPAEAPPTPTPTPTPAEEEPSATPTPTPTEAPPTPTPTPPPTPTPAQAPPTPHPPPPPPPPPPPQHAPRPPSPPTLPPTARPTTNPSARHVTTCEALVRERGKTVFGVDVSATFRAQFLTPLLVRGVPARGTFVSGSVCGQVDCDGEATSMCLKTRLGKRMSVAPVSALSVPSTAGSVQANYRTSLQAGTHCEAVQAAVGGNLRSKTPVSTIVELQCSTVATMPQATANLDGCALRIVVLTKAACSASALVDASKPKLTHVTGCTDSSPPGNTTMCPNAGGFPLAVHGVFPADSQWDVTVGNHTCGNVTQTADGVLSCTVSPGHGHLLNVTARQLLPPSSTEDALELHLEGAVSFVFPFNILDFSAEEDLGVGGLDAELATIFRRVFLSRVVPSKVLDDVAIGHSTGLLLYGPPGTGKTLIARQLAQVVGAQVLIKTGADMLSKFVGESEANVRALFAPAEAAWKKQLAGGPRSDLYILVIDELDSLCPVRGNDNSPAQQLLNNVVDTLLAKLDGVNSLGNVLVLGLTNRRDALDPALLRPGRLDVHVHIKIPDPAGRASILRIHTAGLRDRARLHPDVDLDAVVAATEGFTGAALAGLVRDASTAALRRAFDVDALDLLGFAVTQADMLAAVSTAQAMPHTRLPPSDLLVAPLSREAVATFVEPRRAHPVPVLDAVVADATGLAATLLGARQPPPPLDLEALPPAHDGEPAVAAATSTREAPPGVGVLLHGASGSGLTAAAMAMAAQFAPNNVRLITADTLLEISDGQRAATLRRVFAVATGDTVSAIVLDGVDRLVQGLDGGSSVTFSSGLAHSLATTLSQLQTPLSRGDVAGEPSGTTYEEWVGSFSTPRLLVVATTSRPHMLQRMGLWASAFRVRRFMPLLDEAAASELLRSHGLSGEFGLGDGFRGTVASVTELAHMAKLSFGGEVSEPQVAALRRLLEVEDMESKGVTVAVGGLGETSLP